MPNKEFWKRTKAAAAKAVRLAKGKPDSALRQDWKSKQASRSGSPSYVSISEVRTLGTERTRAIDTETALLLQVAPKWSAEEFYSARVTSDSDFTKGSEHYVTHYFEGASPRVVKAAIPGKHGRHEYSPSVNFNSWRLFQQFVPALDIRGPRHSRSTGHGPGGAVAEHRHQHAIHRRQSSAGQIGKYIDGTRLGRAHR